jgi:hypothetical protein
MRYYLTLCQQTAQRYDRGHTRDSHLSALRVYTRVPLYTERSYLGMTHRMGKAMVRGMTEVIPPLTTRGPKCCQMCMSSEKWKSATQAHGAAALLWGCTPWGVQTLLMHMGHARMSGEIPRGMTEVLPPLHALLGILRPNLLQDGANLFLGLWRWGCNAHRCRWWCGTRLGRCWWPGKLHRSRQPWGC